MTAERLLRCGRFTLPLGRKTYLMAIVNLTDDSFAGGGFLGNPDAAVRAGARFVEQGADIIDVGGESARADRPVVPAQEEIERVVPVIERLAAEIDAPISVDTYKPEVAEEALAAGASIVNDISGFTLGDETARIAARHGAALVVNYTVERPKVRPAAPPQYDDLLTAHVEFLRRGVERATAAGVREESVVVDPGIGFGKSHDEDLEVLRRLRELAALGRPLLVAPSRKHAIAAALTIGDESYREPGERVEGTAAVVALCIAAGAEIVRVHDVEAMAPVMRTADAIVRGRLGDLAATPESWPWPAGSR